MVDGDIYMKLFVTGVCGQLGHDVVNNAVARVYEAVGSDIQPIYSGVADGSAVTSSPYVQLDITDRDAVLAAIEEIRPEAIIHCAAWTAVDAAEDKENKAKVHTINAVGTQNIADAAKAVDAKMLYLSTDYVLTVSARDPGNLMTSAMHLLMYMARANLTVRSPYPELLRSTLL